MLDNNFPGKLYLINQNGGEILGQKVYKSLLDVPEPIDLVSIHIPRDNVLNIIDDCAAKNVPVIHIFAAGFSESGDHTGFELEDKLLQKAKEKGIHIIGPNSAGIYCPASKIPLGATGMMGENGTIGLICQSGSIAAKLVEVGIARNINYSKGISIGNVIRPDSPDFLEYMADDPETTIIGVYIEGTRNSRRLLNVMKKVTSRKPVIVWKGGRTETGASAAASHTGSIATSATNWSVALKQVGVIEVQSLRRAD